MDKKSDRLEDFERYRKGLLSGKELDNFEKKMKTNQAFKSEYSLFEDIEDLLAGDPAEDLAFKKELGRITAQRKKRPIQSEKLAVVSSPAEQPKTDSEPGFNFKSVFWILTLVLLAGWLTISSLNKTASETLPEPLAANKTLSSAAVENPFLKNPSLEYLIKNKTLKSVTCNFEKQQENIILEPGKERASFAIAGFLTGSKISDGKFKCYIFSNKKSDYVDFLPLLTNDLELEKAGEKYLFNFQKKVCLKQGLYYYLIENAKTEEVLVVSKFMVKAGQ